MKPSCSGCALGHSSIEDTEKGTEESKPRVHLLLSYTANFGSDLEPNLSFLSLNLLKSFKPSYRDPEGLLLSWEESFRT